MLRNWWTTLNLPCFIYLTFWHFHLSSFFCLISFFRPTVIYLDLMVLFLDQIFSFISKSSDVCACMGYEIVRAGKRVQDDWLSVFFFRWDLHFEGFVSVIMCEGRDVVFEGKHTFTRMLDGKWILHKLFSQVLSFFADQLYAEIVCRVTLLVQEILDSKLKVTLRVIKLWQEQLHIHQLVKHKSQIRDNHTQNGK